MSTTNYTQFATKQKLMNTFTIYIWGILDNVKCTCIVLVGIAAALTIIPTIIFVGGSGKEPYETTAAYEERRKRKAKMLKFPKFPKIFMPIGFILLIVQALIPSSGTFAAMTIIPEIANSDVIKKDLPDLYQAAMDKLKESLGTEKKVEK